MPEDGAWNEAIYNVPCNRLQAKLFVDYYFLITPGDRLRVGRQILPLCHYLFTQDPKSTKGSKIHER